MLEEIREKLLVIESRLETREEKLAALQNNDKIKSQNGSSWREFDKPKLLPKNTSDDTQKTSKI